MSRRLYFRYILALALIAFLAVKPASAIEIQRVRTGLGLEVWLVEDHSIPLIAVRFGFRGGAASDPAQKAGLANFISGLLDEGAGDLDTQAFQKKLQELAVRLTFDVGKDWFYGRMQTLTKNRDQAFDLLRLALTSPRFDLEPMNRVRAQIEISIKRDAQSPARVAATAWMNLAMGDHPYARPTKGTIETLRAITRDDMRQFIARTLSRSTLKIAVVGDITAADLKTALDKTFGALPDGGPGLELEEAKIRSGPLQQFKQMDIPQTVIQFGHIGLKRHHKDFIPAYIINYILGGGGFSSRLTREIRTKRGLTYSVYSYLNPLRHAGLFLGGAATRGERAGEMLRLIRQEVEKMAKLGPTPEELRDAKTYLTGSYALRFDTGTKIAGQLLGIQVANLGIDYVTRRNQMINAVTIADVRRTARTLLRPGQLIVTIVGKTPLVTNTKAGKSSTPGRDTAKKPL